MEGSFPVSRATILAYCVLISACATARVAAAAPAWSGSTVRCAWCVPQGPQPRVRRGRKRSACPGSPGRMRPLGMQMADGGADGAARGGPAAVRPRSGAAASSRLPGSWWAGPSADDARQMIALLEMDMEEMERMLPEEATAVGRVVTYSRKVFIPLTRLCRDRCAYCTFASHEGLAHPSHQGPPAAFLSLEEVLEIAREGERHGCTEALFTLGDRPEARWADAREQLEELGFSSTIEYLAACCRAVLRETSLLPHANPGVCSEDEMALLRTASVSQGMMLESLSPALMAPGGPHHRSPDKAPRRRLEALETAGRLAVPYTTGLLIGIGESRWDRLQALAAIGAAHRRHGHIQEVILQPFRAKEATGMATSADCPAEELEWTIMAAAHMLSPLGIALQSPPNLSRPHELRRLLSLGVSDWGGVSPVTADYVNPEAPWPLVDQLRALTEASGHRLVPRLPAYPRFVSGARSAVAALDRWQDRALHGGIYRLMDGDGLLRREEGGARGAGGGGWTAGSLTDMPGESDRDRRFLPGGTEFVKWTDWLQVPDLSLPVRRALEKATGRGGEAGGVAAGGRALNRREIESLLRARGPDLAAVCLAADLVRRRAVGGKVSFAVVRNINYTNMCYFKCAFCAFSKGAHDLRGAPYNIGLDEIQARVREAWTRGATEVCLQGGIHPDYTGQTYLDIVAAIKAAQPDMHVHAFSPLEVSQGAATLGLPVRAFLGRLRSAGLGSLPGTAAEVLDDEVREVICPDKLSTAEWLGVVQAAHATGLKTTSTLMFGHVEGPAAIARHLVRLRATQRRSQGITEFVPLPFVHEQAPMYLRGESRQGPSLREAVLVHAVSRLALSPDIANIQASWVKLGPQVVDLVLRAGVNDLGGTLMNESISRAAGAATGQEMTPAGMQAMAAAASREHDERSVYQRTTLYGVAEEARVQASLSPPDLKS